MYKSVTTRVPPLHVFGRTAIIIFALQYSRRVEYTTFTRLTTTNTPTTTTTTTNTTTTNTN